MLTLIDNLGAAICAPSTPFSVESASRAIQTLSPSSMPAGRARSTIGDAPRTKPFRPFNWRSSLCVSVGHRMLDVQFDNLRPIFAAAAPPDRKRIERFPLSFALPRQGR
jgi:hypothetical protein